MLNRAEYIEKILSFIDKPVIKVITGIRRSGKSVIMTQIAETLRSRGVKEKNIIYLNMESLENEQLCEYGALYKEVKIRCKGLKGRVYLFIDEVQEISSWEKALASLLAENAVDIVITGSNAHLLSSELATHITGRYVVIPVYPLTFSEHLAFRGVKKAKDAGALDAEFMNYLSFGGLPGIHHFGEKEMIIEYLSSVMNSILLRDVVMRNAVRDPALLEKICRYVFDNCGNVTTAKGIADYAKSQRLKLSVDTAINYLSFLEGSYLVSRVPRYDIKGKKHLEVFDKYYMGDVGLRRGFIGYRDNDISALLENILYNELQMRGYRVRIGKIGEYEVDFIAEKGEERIYIQCAYLLQSKETIEREYRSLEAVKDSFPKYVVSLDPVTQGVRNGIRHRRLPEFLLEKDWSR
jgi:predicted AAA+ superfamily ATPase